MLTGLKTRTKRLKQEIIPVYYALFDKRTPVIAKILAGLTVVYLLSPIDLIPDFIPIIGLLDDIIIVPLLISITIKLIPKSVLEDIRNNKKLQRKLKRRWYYALPIILLYAYLLYLIFMFVIRLIF
ncbi:protein of unknown function DUF1232 [Pseudopedobacter saltans DSM 12145]|uniref:DUF1232 domain-containing protein n=1 Tax=Pseudopedobacter saltans (strain ATCC 51119 / DSM 12145 / JCM 21818 / CCUG 39354 / LMG 10337 / NBRC 100064 / NCIMB 13643) TaxID=762903 RepID=F0SCU8_PSESL|nr:protein of unknown function DUF1232 [Pseudopedobacter saltans DSM 12145]